MERVFSAIDEEAEVDCGKLGRGARRCAFLRFQSIARSGTDQHVQLLSAKQLVRDSAEEAISIPAD